MGAQHDFDRMLFFEHQAKAEGFLLVIGVDEAGRGPLAGPVVAAAVALQSTQFRNKIHDSKILTPRQREQAFEEILGKAYTGVGIMSESVIDVHNILNATFFAMSNAVTALLSRMPNAADPAKTILLIDGNRFISDLPYSYRTIVDGDALSLSIAAASIVAKVTRDRILAAYDKIFPQYGFASHKGYPTPKHKEAIRQHGLSRIHRKTFSHN